MWACLIVDIFEKEISEEGVDDDTLGVGEQWRSVYPRRMVGELPLRTTRVGFLDAFYDRLQRGESSAFLAQMAADDHREVYVVKSPLKAVMSGRERQLINYHQEARVWEWSDRLEEVTAVIKGWPRVDGWRQGIVWQVSDELRLLRSIPHLAKASMTTKQVLTQEWGRLLDVEATRGLGMVRLPFEQLAMDVLERFKQEQHQPLTLRWALKLWHLSSNEQAGLRLRRRQQKLTEAQAVAFLTTLLRRLGLQGVWKVVVEASQHSVQVDGGARVVRYPQGRQLDGDELVSIPFHEMVHVVGSVNGGKLENPFWQTGAYGYLETEEGLATVAEGLGGLPFGNLRQATIAGRYLAVAMALKAFWLNGMIVPLYSLEDIYEHLLAYQLPAETAAKIVWRVFRGTSLTHQGVELGMTVEGRRLNVPIGECFVRDSVYFRGFVKMLGWFGRLFTEGSTDGQVPDITSITQLEEAYATLQQVQRQDLIRVIATLRSGKLPLALLLEQRKVFNPEAEDGWVDYGEILRPVE